MNILSLFDGISCGRVALERAGIKVDKYYASEIDKYAIQVSQKNYPDIIQIGDVTKVDVSQLDKIDLLIGGSPCQGFSFAGKQLNFKDPRSKLFFEYVRILNDIKKTNPNVKFLLENVKMKQEYQDVISEHLGVKPIFINSRLVSAQNRPRLYWTNIENITQPEDKNILLKDVLQNKVDEKYFMTEQQYKNISFNSLKRLYTIKCGTLTTMQGGNTQPKINIKDNNFTGFSQDNVFIGKEDKTPTLTAGDGGNRPKMYDFDDMIIRKLTPLECERLQTLPDNYTDGVSNSQRYKQIGNGWTVDVIAHIFKNLNT